MSMNADLSSILRFAKILGTVGDGHCFLYAVTRALSLQPSDLSQLDVHGLKCSLFCETVDHLDEYSPFFLPPQNTHTSIIIQLKNYLLKKRFNSSFCDLLPVLTANALRLNFDIFKQNSTGETVKHTVSSNCHTENRIWLHLKNDHYSTLDMNLGLPTTATESRLISNDQRMVYDSTFLRKVNRMAVHKIKRSVRKQLFRLKIWKPGSVSTPVTLHTVTSPPPCTVPVTPSIMVLHCVSVPTIESFRCTYAKRP